MTSSEYTNKATTCLSAEQARLLFHGDVIARATDYKMWGKQTQPEVCVYDPQFELGGTTLTFPNLRLQLKKLRTLVNPEDGLMVNVLAGLDIPKLTSAIYPFVHARVLFGNLDRPHGDAGEGYTFSVCDFTRAREILIVYRNLFAPSQPQLSLTDLVARADQPNSFYYRNAGRMDGELANRVRERQLRLYGNNESGFLVLPLGWRLVETLELEDYQESRKADLRCVAEYFWQQYHYHPHAEMLRWRECSQFTPEVAQRILSHTEDFPGTPCQVFADTLAGTEGLEIHNYAIATGKKFRMTLPDLIFHLPDCKFYTSFGDSDEWNYALACSDWSKINLRRYFSDPLQPQPVPQLWEFIVQGLHDPRNINDVLARFLFGQCWQDSSGLKHFMVRPQGRIDHMLIAIEGRMSEPLAAIIKDNAYYHNLEKSTGGRALWQDSYHGVVVLPMGWRVPVRQSEEDREVCALCYQTLLEKRDIVDDRQTEYDLAKDVEQLSPPLELSGYKD